MSLYDTPEAGHTEWIITLGWDLISSAAEDDDDEDEDEVDDEFDDDDDDNEDDDDDEDDDEDDDDDKEDDLVENFEEGQYKNDEDDWSCTRLYECVRGYW